MGRNRRGHSSYQNSSDEDSDNGEDDLAGNGREKNPKVRQNLRLFLERQTQHVPVCVARTLEDNALALQRAHEKEIEQMNEKRRSHQQRRLSWSDKPSGSQSGKSYLSNASRSRSGMDESKDGFSQLSFDRSSISDISSRFPFPIPLPKEDEYYDAALLFVDISGFTRLSTLLGVEPLSKAINTYFALLIQEVEGHGGDVLKFAGDAFLAEWREESDFDLEEGVLQASLCGATIVKQCSRYHVPQLSEIDADEADNALLDVHCGIGVGQMACLHVGDHQSRREFIFIGDPIDQVSDAINIARHGQLAASPKAISILEETCEILLPEDQEEGRSTIIACNEEQYFEVEDPSLVEDLKQYRLEPPSYLSMDLAPNIMKSLHNQLSLYVHPATRLSHNHNLDAIADAEIRSVYTVFIKPNIQPIIKGNTSEDVKLFSLLNDIMGVTCEVLNKFKGHLRQFIVDDKGVVLIATWGQRGATFPNMVTEKGLPATVAILDALKIELDVDSVIGATFGKVYCGVVGGRHRHEFTLLGPSVNLAARLMDAANNPGILVDDAVRLMASKRFDFFSHPPVKAKGYKDPVPIFEPVSVIERQWNKISNFVGREKELKQLFEIGKLQLKEIDEDPKTHMVLIQAHSGLGKSSLAMQALGMIRRIGQRYKSEVKITKNVCKDGEQRVPFCVFRQILHDLLTERVEFDTGYGAEIKHWQETDGNDSDSSLSMDSAFEEESALLNEERLYARLRALCKELHYNEDFANLVGENMLGLKPVEGASKDQLPPNELIDFVADAVLHLKCTSESKLVISALDDVQWMDSLSWKVVQRMVERGKRLIIICMSRPIATSNTSIDTKFLKWLRDQCHAVQTEYPRFTEIKLDAFTKSDVRKLLSMSFGCEDNCLNNEVCNYLYEQSGGMPYFCQEIVGNMIRKDLLEWCQDGSVNWRSDITNSQKALHSNLNDLLLNRLDDFKSDGRTLIQVCAVLGFEFSLSDLLITQSRGRRKMKQKQIEKIESILSQADKEGILVEMFQGGTETAMEDDETERFAEKSYMFRHSIWRNCLLGTMLEERKRELHKTIAIKLGGDAVDEVKDLRFAMKLFGHWRDSGELGTATERAISIGKHLDNLLLLRQSIEFCIEAIGMWKNDSSDKDDEEEVVAEISSKALNNVTPDQLSSLARLHISIAKNYSNIRDAVNSNIFYERCDLILSKSSVAADLKDRSVFFVLYSGRFSLLYIGAIPDDGLVLQMEIASKFVVQAELQGDRVHICRSLSMKSLTLSRQGNFEEALVIQKKLEDIYDAKALCDAICEEYSCDHTAQNYGYSVLWYEILGRFEEAQLQIEFILDELMPEMPATNMHNSMMILYPVIFVLKEKGKPRKAEKVFLTFIYDRFYEFYGEDSTTYFLFIYEPLRILFRLVREIDEGSTPDEEELAKLEDWVLSPDIGTYSEIQWGPMCAMGRDPYCIIAEICLLLVRIRCNDQNDNERKEKLMQKGLDQAKKSKECVEGNPGFAYARKFQSERIMAQLL